MGMTYKGIILTNHALERMRERSVTQEMVFVTLTKPDRSRYADAKQKFIYNKTFGRDMVEVVASQNERKEWVVVSVWSREASRLNHTTNQYYVRNGLIDKLLDWVEAFFRSRLKKGERKS
jgi:cytidylate kinase